MEPFKVTDGTRSWNLSEWQAQDKALVDSGIRVVGPFPEDSSNLFSYVHTSITFGYTNTSAVKSMAGMFRGCSVFNAYVNMFDTRMVEDMTDMFRGCSLFNQSLSSFYTSKVTGMAGMFYGCSSFNQNLLSFDTSEVESMAYMFYQCSSFNNELSNFTATLATDLEGMFYSCQVLSVLDLGNFIVNDGCNVADMFYYTPLLTEFTKVKGQQNSLLESVKPSTLIAPASPDWYRIGLGEDYPFLPFYVTDGNSVWNSDQWKSFGGKSSLVNDITVFGNAPEDCGWIFHMLNVNINLDNMTTFGVTSMKRMFNVCRKFNSSVSSFDTRLVKDMAFMFYECDIFDQPVSNFDTSLVVDMDGMFAACFDFNQSVANFNTHENRYFSYMFTKCRSFNQVDVLFDMSAAGTCSYMFNDCISLEKLNLSKSAVPSNCGTANMFANTPLLGEFTHVAGQFNNRLYEVKPAVLQFPNEEDWNAAGGIQSGVKYPPATAIVDGRYRMNLYNNKGEHGAIKLYDLYARFKINQPTPRLLIDDTHLVPLALK